MLLDLFLMVKLSLHSLNKIYQDQWLITDKLKIVFSPPMIMQAFFKMFDHWTITFDLSFTEDYNVKLAD